MVDSITSKTESCHDENLVTTNDNLSMTLKRKVDRKKIGVLEHFNHRRGLALIAVGDTEIPFTS